MSTTAVAEVKKELVDLKIRVNNLEKKVSKIQQEMKPKAKTHSTHKFI